MHRGLANKVARQAHIRPTKDHPNWVSLRFGSTKMTLYTCKASGYDTFSREFDDGELFCQIPLFDGLPTILCRAIIPARVRIPDDATIRA